VALKFEGHSFDNEEKTLLLSMDSHSANDKLGRFFCCRKLAPVSFPILEKNRHTALFIAHVICAIGVFLSVLAYVGAFAWGTTLSYLSWITIHNPEGTGYAGVMYICQDAPQFSIYSNPQSTPSKLAKDSTAVSDLDRVEKLKSEVKDLKGLMQSTSEDMTKMNAKVFGIPELKETKAMLLQAAKTKIRHQQRPMTMSFHLKSEIAGQDEGADDTRKVNWKARIGRRFIVPVQSASLAGCTLCSSRFLASLVALHTFPSTCRLIKG